jgi:hypothetical protein
LLTNPPTRGRAARLRGLLSERDLGVLVSLYQLRLMTSDQVQRTHIPDGSPRTRARRTRALLQRLSELGLVVRLARTVGGGRSGSTSHVYGLSGLGLAVLNVQGPYGRRRRRVWETKPHFLLHVLAVSELCVRLSELATGDVELLRFDGEPACWRRYAGPGGVPATLKPDAYVRIGVGKIERIAFIELDMDTESVPTIRAKCQDYVNYFNTGTEQHTHRIFPLVMWLVPTETRQHKVREVIDHLTADVQRLFTVALQADGPALLAAPAEGRE